MKTTIEFLEAVKATYGLKSNYALARKMEQTDTDVARWMKGKNTLGDEAALKVADLLELDPAFVMASVHAEREKSVEVKKVWEHLAKLASGVVAGVLLSAIIAVGMAGYKTGGINALSTISDARGIYIMRHFSAPEWLVLLAFFVACLLALPKHNGPKH